MTVVEKKLDSCTVSVYPPLNPDHETLTLPENMMNQFGIVANVNRDGVVVSGADMIYNYEQVCIIKQLDINISFLQTYKSKKLIIIIYTNACLL
jgi:hypothetical protein